MAGPERQDVVSIARQGVEKLLPELELPDDGNGLLGGRAGVVVAGTAGVEGDVVLQSAAEDVRLAGHFFHGVEPATERDLFGQFEPAIHAAQLVAAHDGDCAIAFLADAEGLRPHSEFENLETDLYVGVAGDHPMSRALQRIFDIANTEGDLWIVASIDNRHLVLRLAGACQHTKSRHENKSHKIMSSHRSTT